MQCENVVKHPDREDWRLSEKEKRERERERFFSYVCGRYTPEGAQWMNLVQFQPLQDRETQAR